MPRSRAIATAWITDATIASPPETINWLPVSGSTKSFWKSKWNDHEDPRNRRGTNPPGKKGFPVPLPAYRWRASPSRSNSAPPSPSSLSPSIETTRLDPFPNHRSQETDRSERSRVIPQRITRDKGRAPHPVGRDSLNGFEPDVDTTWSNPNPNP